MATYPCQRCFQAFPGEAHNVYLTLFQKEDKAAFRYVVCPGCEEELVEEWVQRALHKNEANDWILAVEGSHLEDCWVAPTPGRNGWRGR